MAVKVVSDGPVKTESQVCSGCGYELEYTPNDVKEDPRKDYTGSTDIALTLQCPRTECSKVMTIGWR